MSRKTKNADLCSKCGKDRTQSKYKTVCSEACAKLLYSRSGREPVVKIYDTSTPGVRLRNKFLLMPARAA